MTEQGSPIVYDKNDVTSFTFDNAPDARGDDEERLNSLAGGGPLWVHPLNNVARALKTKYVIKADGGTCIHQHLIDSIMIPLVIFDNDARKLSARFAFTAESITRWFKTVGDADVVFYPGSEPNDIAQAIDKAKLPTFTVTPHDFLLPDELALYGEDQDGETTATSDTGTFFDHIAIGHFKPCDLARFKMLMSHHYTAQDRSGVIFQGLAETMIATLTNDPGEDKQKAQATMVLIMINSTRPPYSMRRYCDPDDTATEIGLMGRSAAERFAPCLEAQWQQFAELNALWPNETAVEGMCDRVQALAAGLALPGANEPTYAGVINLCQSIAPYVKGLLSTTAAERTAEIISAFRTARDTDRTAKETTMTSEQMLTMQGDAKYRKLVTDLDAIVAKGGNIIEQVTTMLCAEHAAGVMFGGGTKINIAFWRDRAGLQAMDAIAGSINKSLAFDRTSTAQDWGIMVEASHCKEFIRGDFNKPNFLWKSVVRPVLERTVASEVIAAAETDAGETLLWGSPALLVWAEPILKRAFAAIGYGGNAAGGWYSFYKYYARMLTAVCDWPHGIAQREPVLKALIKAAGIAIDGAHSAFAMMRQTPPSSAKRTSGTRTARRHTSLVQPSSNVGTPRPGPPRPRTGRTISPAAHISRFSSFTPGSGRP